MLKRPRHEPPCKNSFFVFRENRNHGVYFYPFTVKAFSHVSSASSKDKPKPRLDFPNSATNSHADFSTAFSVFSAVICPFPMPWVLSFISRILMVAKISFRSSAKDILLMYIRSIFSLSLGSVL